MSVDPTKLRELILTCFNNDEIILLCTRLHVRYEDLPASLSMRVNELVGLLCRESREEELLKYLKEQRPRVDWQQVILPSDKVDAPDAAGESAIVYTFANRHDDKIHIMSILKREYNVLLHGPSGIGKTYFAQELFNEEWCQNKQTAYIDLRQLPYYPDDPQKAADILLQQLRHQLFNTLPHSLLKRVHLIGGLAQAFRDINQCGLIILDNADYADPAVLHELRTQILPDLYELISDPALYPHLIVIAPYQLDILSGYTQPKFSQYLLQEFQDVLTDTGAYKQLLIQAHNKWTKTQWDEHDHALDQLLTEWAKQLYDLTAGHPLAIIRVLDFVGEKTRFNQDNIFSDIEADICRYVLRQLVHDQVAKHVPDPEKQQAFQHLWTFRYISNSVYEVLQETIPNKKHWQPLNDVDLRWNPLNVEGLLQKDVPSHQLLTYRLSPLWHKLSNFILRITEPDLYRQLHSDARAVYERITYDKLTDSNMMRISCFGEMLYQLAQEHLLDDHTDDSRRQFTAKVHSYLEKLIPYIQGSQPAAEFKAKLQEMVKKDTELCVLLNEVGKNDTVKDLVTGINQI